MTTVNSLLLLGLVEDEGESTLTTVLSERILLKTNFEHPAQTKVIYKKKLFRERNFLTLFQLSNGDLLFS